jgi:hypothetical protein
VTAYVQTGATQDSCTKDYVLSNVTHLYPDDRRDRLLRNTVVTWRRIPNNIINCTLTDKRTAMYIIELEFQAGTGVVQFAISTQQTVLTVCNIYPTDCTNSLQYLPNRLY